MESISKSEKNVINSNCNHDGIVLLQSKPKSILLNIIRSIINDQSLFSSEQKIQNDEIQINVYSSSDKGFINNLYYWINIQNTSFNPKRDTKNNLEKYRKINSKNYTTIDECNLPVGKNFFTFSINLIPILHKKMIIDFSLFNFYFYNGKISNRFVLQPHFKNSSYDDNNKKKLFLYVYGIETADKINKIKDVLNELNKIKSIWTLFSFIYIIIPVSSEITMKKIYSILPEEITPNNAINKNISSIFLIGDNDEEKYINIFSTRYNQKKLDYFFILDNKNTIIELKRITGIVEYIKKITPIFISYDHDPVQVLKNVKIAIREKLENLFYGALFFLNNIMSIQYLLSFKYEFIYTLNLNKNIDDFTLRKVKKVKLGGILRTKDFMNFKNLFNGINIPHFHFNVKESPTIDIDINFDTELKCKICKTTIPNNTEHFYCYFCKENYCFNCVKTNFNTKEGKNKFIDNKHNLLFFKTNNKNFFKNLDKYKLGNNKFAQPEITEFKNKHSAICDGCSNNFIGSPRFICISCRPGIKALGGFHDYCLECIEHMMKNDDFGKKIESKVEMLNTGLFESCHVIKNMHNHSEHIYLMVALEGKFLDYYSF